MLKADSSLPSAPRRDSNTASSALVATPRWAADAVVLSQLACSKGQCPSESRQAGGLNRDPRETPPTHTHTCMLASYALAGPLVPDPPIAPPTHLQGGDQRTCGQGSPPLDGAVSCLSLGAAPGSQRHTPGGRGRGRPLGMCFEGTSLGLTYSQILPGMRVGGSMGTHTILIPGPNRQPTPPGLTPRGGALPFGLTWLS